MGAAESAEFETTSFGEGRSRRAYKGTYKSKHTGTFTWLLSKDGDPCVVKEFKERYAWAKTDWDSEVRVLEKSKELARRFNKDTGTTRPVQYVWSDVWKVTKSVSTTPKLGEWCMVEDYIEGKWKKWNANAGYVNANAPTMSLHAFSHWTYAHSGGQLLICDLQGVHYDDKYVLTDPVINSVERQYGEMDMGVAGMALFFSTHECTTFCNTLPKPPRSLNDDVRSLRQAGVHKARHTSYSSEDVFRIPAGQQRRMKEKLVSVPGLDRIAEED